MTSPSRLLTIDHSKHTPTVHFLEAAYDIMLPWFCDRSEDEEDHLVAVPRV